MTGQSVAGRTREEWDQLPSDEMKQALRELRKEWQQMARALVLPTPEFRALSNEIDLIEEILNLRNAPPPPPSNPTLL